MNRSGARATIAVAAPPADVRRAPTHAKAVREAHREPTREVQAVAPQAAAAHTPEAAHRAAIAEAHTPAAAHQEAPAVVHIPAVVRQEAPAEAHTPAVAEEAEAVAEAEEAVEAVDADKDRPANIQPSWGENTNMNINLQGESSPLHKQRIDYDN